MNKIVSIVGAAAAVAAMSLSAIAPATAAPPHMHRDFSNPGAAIGLGILGFAAGAAIAGSASRGYYGYGPGYGGGYYGGGYGWRAHVAACLDAYRSYDPRTDTYLGYDGYRHQCEL